MESLRRRDFIRGMSFLSVAAGVKAASASYNPAAKFDVKVSEIEYRRTKNGRQLMARIYEPAGTGPFPTVLDLHGGAWNAKDRKAEEPMDRAIAESGVLVVAVDLTLAPESPYPACVQDANYAVRWLKTKAASWNGNPAKIGIWQFEWRPRCGVARHAAGRCAIQRDPVAGSAEDRCLGRLRRHAFAHQQPIRPLPECGTTEAQSDGEEP